MYKNAAIPKAIFTTWMIMWGRLLTTDRLLKWRMKICNIVQIEITMKKLIIRNSHFWKEYKIWKFS